MSYINDNRTRIRSRVAQLNTGVRHSQTPPSVLRRTVSNFEVSETRGDTVTVASNFVLVEYRFDLTLWAGRYLHTDPQDRGRPAAGREDRAPGQRRRPHPHDGLPDLRAEY